MLRIIARLDIKNDAVIKGIHLEGQRKVGAPLELAADYYKSGVDEVLFMDSVASLYGRSNLFDTIALACRSVFVPITLGGGIRSVEDVERALEAGADKVAINTALTREPSLVEKIATIYGSQCLVGSIEAKRTGQRWEAYVSNGREPTGRDVFEWASELESRGIGELLVTSVDREGTQRGFDIDLYESLSAKTTVPVVACGGAGSLAHVKELVDRCAPQGVALASILHYKKSSVESLKAALPGVSRRARRHDAGHT
jgi:cyclase